MAKYEIRFKASKAETLSESIPVQAEVWCISSDTTLPELRYDVSTVGQIYKHSENNYSSELWKTKESAQESLSWNIPIHQRFESIEAAVDAIRGRFEIADSLLRDFAPHFDPQPSS